MFSPKWRLVKLKSSVHAGGNYQVNGREGVSELSKTNNEERKVSLLIGQILEDGAGIVEDRFEDDKTPTDKYFNVAHKLTCDHFWHQISVHVDTNYMI